MSGSITRIIRFVSDDGKTYSGEDPKDFSKPATVLSGSLFGGTLTRTTVKKKIVKLLTPVVPRDIFCIGLNYRKLPKHFAYKHHEESAKKRDVPSKPVVFMKPTSCLLNPGEDVWIPSLENGHTLDWEVELAVVIGQKCRNVAPEDALNYVAGYTVANDVSCRYWQKNAGANQFIKGKSFDTFAPIGPVLVTPEAIPDPQALRLCTHVNGVKMQDEATKDMIFSCAECISWLSNNMTLMPGQIIFTGTPSGAATGRDPPNWLKVGDVVQCTVSGIGTISNKIAAAPTSSSKL